MKAAAKDLGIETQKTSFPHHLIKSLKDLEKKTVGWSDVIEKGVFKIKKGVGYVERTHIIIWDKKTQLRTLRYRCTEYIKTDVKCLKQLWESFQNMILDMFNIDIPNNIYTAAAFSYEFFRMTMHKKAKNNYEGRTIKELSESYYNDSEDEDIQLYPPNVEALIDISKAKYGGKVWADGGIYDKGCYYIDGNSLYPSAQFYFLHPWGRRINAKGLNIDALYRFINLYDKTMDKVVELKENEDIRNVLRNPEVLELKNKVKNDKLGIYMVCIRKTRKIYKSWTPMKDHKTGELIFGKKKYTGWYSTILLCIALKEGYTIEYLGKGHQWIEKGYIFNTFIYILYGFKKKYKNKNPVKYAIIKLLITSLWGKLCQKPYNDTIYLLNNDQMRGLDRKDISIICKAISEYLNMVKITDKTPYTSKPTQNGVFVLDGSKFIMKYYQDLIRKEGDNVDIPYGDTDSFFLLAKGFKSYHIVGKELGQMSYEVDSDIPGYLELLKVAGKKMYQYDFIGNLYDDDRNIIKKHHYHENHKLKGIPKKMQCSEAFDYIIENPGVNKVYVDTFRMKRGIVTVSSDYGKKCLVATAEFV